jgi:TetR/AcrR family transcriptional regulator
MASPAKPDDNEAAGLISRAAARLFALRGFEATSTREIVEEAGLAKPTLYYHFGSKEGLARSLLVEPLSRLVARLGEIVAEGGDPALALSRILDAHFDYCREDPDRSRFFFAAAFGPPEGPSGSLMACPMGDLRAATDAALRRCVDAGLVREGDLDDFSTMYRGLLTISIIDYLYHDKPLGEDRARVLVATLLRAFEGAADGGRDGRA